MFIKFNDETQRIIKNAKVEMQKLNHPFIGSEHLVLSILKSNSKIVSKINEYGINYDNFKNLLIKTVGIGKSKNNYLIYTPLLKRILENALMDAKDNNLEEVNTNTLFLSLLDEGEGIAIRLFHKLGVNVDEMYNSFNNKQFINHKKNFYEYGIDLTEKALEGKIDPLIGRDNEVDKIIEILLRRDKNNPLLIGEAGVGKTRIVEGLALRIVNGDVPNSLKKYHIISIMMSNLVSGTKYRGEFEERINKLLKELENDHKTIIFIDEIHTIVGAGGAEGAIDAANIIKPALARGKIKLIGATTNSEYKKTILKDKALDRRFQKIDIKEPNTKETIDILKKVKYLYEEYHHVNISDNVINKIVMMSNKYLYNKKNPDKALDILDELCAKTFINKDKNNSLNKLNNELKSLKKNKFNLIINHSYDEALKLKDKELLLENKINNLSLKTNKKNPDVLESDIYSIIERNANVPIFENPNRKNNLLYLEKYLNDKIIGQENVIKTLTRETKKLFYGYKERLLPTSFLFVGSSGVGKTSLVEKYSEYLNINLIRLDMSEYKEDNSINKIIGSPPGYIGYDDNDYVLEKIRDNPFSIILLDEIEKASSNVINLFLQVLDNGYLTDSKGEKISLCNTIIIMTSNIGSDKEIIGFNEKSNQEKELNNILSTIFVNRINHICYFNKLNEKNIHYIVQKNINKLRKKYKDYNMEIHISKRLIKEIINDSNYEIYGARKIKQNIENKIDSLIIDNLLDNKKYVSLK